MYRFISKFVVYEILIKGTFDLKFVLNFRACTAKNAIYLGIICINYDL